MKNKAVEKLRIQRDRAIRVIRDDWRFPLGGELCKLLLPYLQEDAGPTERAGFKRLPPPPPMCRSIGHCAVGALLFAAGVSNKRLEKYAGEERIPGTPFAAIMEKRYGLFAGETMGIEQANDNESAHTPQQRRKDVLARVRRVYRWKMQDARDG